MPIVPLYGHHTLRQRLLHALQGGALPASLLFHGPAGVGKQRLALWLAQALVCDRDDRPCGVCQHCRFALELSHPDIHWYFPRPAIKAPAEKQADAATEDIREARAERTAAHGLYPAPDGKSAIGVAFARSMLHVAARTPALAHRKVFIVGDAERMVAQEGSDESANAVLKLIEEPADDTTVILTSSERDALLPTIRSRVVAVRVAPLPPADVSEFLSNQAVADALAEAHGSLNRNALVQLANGAPGTLLGSENRDGATAAARAMLEAAQTRDLAGIYAAALSSGSSGARGAFTDSLESLTVLLRDVSREAVAVGDDRTSRNAAAGVDTVEDARGMAHGNVNPQLIAADVMLDLARRLS